jgi:glycosyltransferase involved in cell wall biosynthesis
VSDPTSTVVPHDLAFAHFRVGWSDSRRRGGYFAQDRLAHAVVHHDRIERLLLADAPRHPLAIAVAQLRGEEIPLPGISGRTHLRLLSPTLMDPTAPATLRAVYRVAGTRLRRAVRRAGLNDPVLLTANPFLAAFASLEWARAVTLFLTDDFPASDVHRPWREGHHAAWEELRRRGTRVAAVSQIVLDRVAPTGPALVVPNGVDREEWSAPPRPPAWFMNAPAPRLLYAGGLDDRIDPVQLRAAAEASNGGTVFLVGPTFDAAYVDELAQIPHVRVHGRVDRGEITALVYAADACLLPHRRTDLTAAMSPLKLYEYLAAGRPVAAIDLPPVRRVDERVFIARRPEDFGDAVRAALTTGPMDEVARRMFVDANSWSSRHRALLGFAAADHQC